MIVEKWVFTFFLLWFTFATGMSDTGYEHMAEGVTHAFNTGGGR